MEMFHSFFDDLIYFTKCYVITESYINRYDVDNGVNWCEMLTYNV